MSRFDDDERALAVSTKILKGITYGLVIMAGVLAVVMITSMILTAST